MLTVRSKAGGDGSGAGLCGPLGPPGREDLLDVPRGEGGGRRGGGQVQRYAVCRASLLQFVVQDEVVGYAQLVVRVLPP